MQRRLLRGSFWCSLDERFRVAIPARLRDPFLDGATVGWWLDDCLLVVPRGEWDTLMEETFGNVSVFDDDAREMRRYLHAGAFDQPPLDRQGRLLIPQELREHASLGGRVKVVGVADHLEIWDPERLDRHWAELRQEGVSNRAKRLLERKRPVEPVA